MNGKLTARSLTPIEVTGILTAKVNWLLGACSPEKIILFGSAATGHMTTASDVDLIIIFKTVAEIELAKPKLFQSRPATDWPHDLLFYDVDAFRNSVQKGGGVCWIAAQDGRILYQRNL